MAPSTAATNEYIFGRWVEWLRERGVGLTPDEMVELQRRRRGFELLDLAERFVSELDGRVTYKRRCLTAIRSFFLHNRAPLPQDPSFRLRGSRPKTVGRLTVDEFRLLLGGFNPLYRAVFLCMFQGGMGLGEVVYWSMNGWDSLVRQLDRGATLVRVDLPGRKRRRNVQPYYTFIGTDAIAALRDYLRLRGRKPGAIFLGQMGQPLSRQVIYLYWHRHLKRLGLYSFPRPDKRNRTGRNPHELRDLFRTRWEKSPAKPSVAEFLMGHRVDPLEYNKAMRDEDYVRREYLKALPWLNVLSEEPEKVSRADLEEERYKMQRQLEELRETVRALQRAMEVLQKRRVLETEHLSYV